MDAWLENFLQIKRSDLAGKKRADLPHFNQWIELVRKGTRPTLPRIKKKLYNGFRDAVWEALVEDFAQYHTFQTDGQQPLYELLCPALGLEIVALPIRGKKAYAQIRRLQRDDSLVFAAPRRNIPTLQRLAIDALHGDLPPEPWAFKDQMRSHFAMWFHDRLKLSECELSTNHRGLLKAATWTALTAPSTVRDYHHIGKSPQKPGIRFQLHCASEWLGLETETDRKKQVVAIRRKLPSGPLFQMRTDIKTVKQRNKKRKRRGRARSCWCYMTGDQCRCEMWYY